MESFRQSYERIDADNVGLTKRYLEAMATPTFLTALEHCVS